jgi:hypothetical protein
MLKRFQHLPLAAIVLLWAMGGVAEHARPLTFTEFSTAKKRAGRLIFAAPLVQ